METMTASSRWVQTLLLGLFLDVPVQNGVQVGTTPSSGLVLTGGKGVFTWRAHGEFIVSSETIRPPITHQAHAGYFLKEFINSPTWYPPGTWWVLFKSAYDNTQWKRRGQNGWVLS